MQADVVFKVLRPEEKREGNKKYFYPVVGVAFIEEHKIDIKISSIPLHWDGELIIFLPKN